MATVSTTELATEQPDSAPAHRADGGRPGRVQRDGDGQDNTVRWRTGVELNTFGFHLWARPRRSTPRPHHACDDLRHRQRQQLCVCRCRGDAAEFHWLEEVESTGRSVLYGPFAGTPGRAPSGSNSGSICRWSLRSKQGSVDFVARVGNP
ncbi:MAG: hypothetical protein R2838_18460 [Caldilineaceae bacterium]